MYAGLRGLDGAVLSGNSSLLVDDLLLQRILIGKRLLQQIGLKKHPLGQYGLYTFFDAGNVALAPGQLASNGMRTDVGVGVSVAVQNKIVLRGYIAFGAGEGSHPNVKMANAF